MDQHDREEIAQLNASATEILRSLNARGGMRGGNNVSTMNVNHGGFGVSVALCSCQFVMMVAMGILYIDQSRKLDRLQDEMNVVIQWAPQLKDIIAKQLDHKEEKP